MSRSTGRDPAGGRQRGTSLSIGDRQAVLSDQLSALAVMGRSDLVEHWNKVVGCPPPSGLSRRLLALAIAYHLQARELGGLPPAVQRQLRHGDRSTGSGSGRKRSLRLTPGMRLVRQWQGRTHTVEVTTDGFLYLGQRYRSLSQVARTITGTHWSGPRFFLP